MSSLELLPRLPVAVEVEEEGAGPLDPLVKMVQAAAEGIAVEVEAAPVVATEAVAEEEP